MNPRNKLSPPPPPKFTEGDSVVLTGFVHSHGYQLLLDEMQRYAISMEIELLVADIGDSRATLERVYQARAAWMVIDRIQQQIANAIEETREARERERPKTEPEVRDERNAEILGT